MSKFLLLGLATIGFYLLLKSDYSMKEIDPSWGQLLLGDYFSLISILFIAIFSVCIDEVLAEQSIGNNFHYMWFIGFVGLFNIWQMVPILVVMDKFNFEPLREVPDFGYTIVMHLYSLSAIFGVYCWFKSIKGLGPFYASALFSCITFPIAII